jgi:endonuclease-8
VPVAKALSAEGGTVPEGHTLHRLALDVTHTFGGRVVSVTSPQGRFAESAAQLDQTRLIGATAHGKHLFCEFDGDRLLHIHLGLIGSLELGPPTPPRGEVRVRIATEQAAADLRGPQLCTVRTPAEVALRLRELGPDPLRADANPDLAWLRIHRATRPIAALLMDQTILSGVGNVYRAEVLSVTGSTRTVRATSSAGGAGWGSGLILSS